MLSPHHALLILGLGGAMLARSTDAAENWVLIGDSLTKEYSIEFPLLHPDNPASWDERNWIELLSEHRPDHVDIGRYSAFWPDTRLRGHEYNWAFPGSTSADWENILTDTSLGGLQNALLRLQLNPYLADVADRVVIFLGGNDLKNNYGTYYDGADPASFIASLVSNIEAIIDYVRDQNGSVPIVLANMPDVGVTPVVLESKPDPVKRQRNTALTTEVNRRLRVLAGEKGIGFADIGALTDELAGPRRYVIGGIHFEKGVDPNPLSNDAEYLFSPDGFHPNTAAHLLFANAIVQGFNRQYPDLSPVPPFTTEEMLRILGFDPDMPLGDWAAAYGVDAGDPQHDGDGDNWSLLAEFALGMDPRVAEPHRAPTGRLDNDRVEIHYELRLTDSEHFQATPHSSNDLVEWHPVPETNVVTTGDHRFASWIDIADFPQGFLRLTFRMLP